MAEFHMLAGTVSSAKILEEFEALLLKAGIKSTVLDDEMELDGQVNLTFRSGFEHEYIVVGDAIDQTLLKHEVQLLSDVLKQNQIQHEFEIYDMANELIDVIEYKP